MEVLSDILTSLRTAGSVYFCDTLTPPWTLEYAGETRAMFHLVRRGHCLIDVEGQERRLDAGDFVFFAPGVDHILSGPRKENAETMLLCGYCRFATDADNLLLRALPRAVLLRRDELEFWPWLLRTFEHLSAEYLSEEPGNELSVNKLTEILLVQLLRIDFGRSNRPGIVAALRDRRIARALTEIHEDPGRNWTLDRAAGAASMSRSGFARRFKDTVEMSFYEYLTGLRMRVARELLNTTGMRVAEVGERVGYRSDLSFVKAFKRVHRMTPRAYRSSN